MGKPEFESEEVLGQAKGNQTAVWHLAVLWARQQQGSVDGWAAFVGTNFAPSWDDMGEGASAMEVARIAGLNIATTADMDPVDLTGDESQATLTVKGPETEWLDNMGTTIDDLDRVNEVIFGAIADRRGLDLTQEREGDQFRMTFTKR